MSAFLKKLILKWSAITTLGVGAYLLGFSSGAVALNHREIAEERIKLEQERLLQASGQSQKSEDLREIKDLHDIKRLGNLKRNLGEPENFIFLPTSQQPTNLSQLK